MARLRGLLTMGAFYCLEANVTHSVVPSVLLIPGRLFKFTVIGNNCNNCAIIIKLPTGSRRSSFVFCRIIFQKYFIKAIED